MRLHSFKWLLVAGLVAGSAKAYHSRTEIAQWFRRHQLQADGLDKAMPSQVYFLEPERWLEFDLPHGLELARLISNASVSPTNPAPSGTQWPYAVEYQLCGLKGPPLAAGVYHFKGTQLLHADRQSGNTVEANSYMDADVRPLGGRQWMLNLEEFPAAVDVQLLRLRLHSAHPDILDVAVRVYFQNRVAERKLAYRWNRLSDDQKRDLARGNVYSFEGLTTEEKHGLLRFQWLVAAPEGVPGRDFRRRILYVRDDSESLRIVKDWLPAGIPVDADHWGVVAITNASATCQIQLSSLSPAAPSHQTLGERQPTRDPLSPNPQLSIINYQFSSLQPSRPPQTNHLAWSGAGSLVLLPGNDMSLDRGEGMIAIAATQPAFVRVFSTESGLTNDITPEPANLVTFVVSPTNSIEYAVCHSENEPTLFRVDVRTPLSPPGRDGSPSRPPDDSQPPSTPLAPERNVRFELLAQDGSIFQSGNVALTNTFSSYDWLITTNRLEKVTDPQSLCFVLPASVRTLRILSPTETLLVNAYSRPVRLSKQLLLPADYSPTGRLAPHQPSWFTLRPIDYLQRRDAGDTALVRLQARPPECDPLVLAGQYEWESFLPTPDPTGRMLLVACPTPTAANPATPAATPRTDSLAYSYFPVAVGPQVSVRFQGAPWERDVSPDLVLISTNGSPCSVQVHIDGRPVFNQRLGTRVASVRLGTLSAGDHTLRILATGDVTGRSPVPAQGAVAAYINYFASDLQPAFLKRFCVRASSNQLGFHYTKRQPGAEALVLRVFSPLRDNPAPFKVRVTLKPAAPAAAGPFPELTFLEREAWVTPGSIGNSFLIAADPSPGRDGSPQPSASPLSVPGRAGSPLHAVPSPSSLDDGQPIFLPVGPDIPVGDHEIVVDLDADSPRWLSLSRTTPGLAEKLEISSNRLTY